MVNVIMFLQKPKASGQKAATSGFSSGLPCFQFFNSMKNSMLESGLPPEGNGRPGHLGHEEGRGTE